jgi:hypothetical protein
VKYSLVQKNMNLGIKISNELTGAALTVNAEHDRRINSAPILRCERKKTEPFFLKKMFSQIVYDARSSEQHKQKTMLSIQGFCITEHATSIHEDRSHETRVQPRQKFGGTRSGDESLNLSIT